MKQDVIIQQYTADFESYKHILKLMKKGFFLVDQEYNPKTDVNEYRLKKRWNLILRSKASMYEHPARKAGETVFGPSLDDLANEMEAFFIALELLK